MRVTYILSFTVFYLDKLEILLPDKKLKQMFVFQEKKFFTLLERLLSQPLAYKRKEFFDRFPRLESYASKEMVKREVNLGNHTPVPHVTDT